MHNSALRVKARQLTAGLTSTCPQTDVNGHPVSLGEREWHGPHIWISGCGEGAVKTSRSTWAGRCD